MNLGQFEAETYGRTNQIQMKDGLRLVQDLKKLLDDKQLETVIDIGCGTGNLTVMFAEQLKCKQIVAFDLKPEMIAYASQNHSHHKIRYEVANILDDSDQLISSIKLESGADLILSNHCLQWVSEQPEKVLMNIFKMLKPGGHAYLQFNIWTEILPVIEHVTWYPKWRKYFPKIAIVNRRDSDAMATPCSRHLMSMWEASAKKVGFTNLTLTTSSECFLYSNVNDYLDVFQNILKYFKEIPAEEVSEFRNDIQEIIHDTCSIHQDCYPKFQFNYENVVMFMQKPGSNAL